MRPTLSNASIVSDSLWTAKDKPEFSDGLLSLFEGLT